MNSVESIVRENSAPRALPAGAIGAVVVGGDYQGLGIVRSLGRHGIPVCVVDDEISISGHSRYAQRAIRVQSLRQERTAVEALLEIGRKFELFGWVLYPTREELVAAFSRYRCELSTVFTVPTPEWPVVEPAWDKRVTYERARDLGIPVPRTWVAHTNTDLAKIDGEPPYAIKPAIKEHFVYATKAKAWRANSRKQLEELFERASLHIGSGEVLIQELIPGDGRQQFAYCAFFKNGEAQAKMVVRRRRQHPLEFGRASTLVETIENPLLESMSEKFLRSIDYYGLVEIEYKLDLRTGEYKLLDVNARTWGYHSLGYAAGIDFPYLLFADQMGLPVEYCTAQAGVKWIRFTTDLPAALLEIFTGRTSWREYLGSLRGLGAEAVFCREDPLPGLAEVALIPYLFVKRGF